MQRSEILKEMLGTVKDSVDADIYNALEACVQQYEDEIDSLNKRLAEVRKIEMILRGIADRISTS